jgi:hypothetical protein
MPRPSRALLPALIAMLAIAACSPAATPPGTSGATPKPLPTSQDAPPTNVAAPGEPCSFLTAEQVGVIVGTTPVAVEERVGRGDCDYWLTAAKDAKVNIGVTTGPDAAGLFESTKGLGTPQPITLGDEAFSIFNESIGTLVVVRKGESVAVVQVFGGTDSAKQLTDATALAEAVVTGL